MTVDEMLRKIDDECSPDKMSQEEALEFLQGIAEELELRIDALRSDLRR